MVGRAVWIDLGEHWLAEVLVELSTPCFERSREELLLLTVRTLHALYPLFLVPGRLIFGVQILQVPALQERLKLLLLGELLEVLDEVLLELFGFDNAFLVLPCERRELFSPPNRDLKIWVLRSLE